MKDYIKRLLTLSSKPIKYERQPTYGPAKPTEKQQASAYEAYRTALGKTIMDLESSGGTNKANADPGEQKWLTGLTEIAIKELERVGRLRPTFHRNNPDEVVDASVDYFELMKERNPGRTDQEVYTDNYWTQGTGEQIKKKQEEFKGNFGKHINIITPQ